MGNARSSARLLILSSVLSLISCFGSLKGASEGSGLTWGEEDILTVVAVGDILLSRNVGKKIDITDNPGVPFENVKQYLATADIAFGNLESPIGPGTVPIVRGVVFKCLTRYVPGLVEAGFDVLSTANNHALDQGTDNVEFTVNYLESHKILAVGSRRIGDQTSFGRVIRRKGVAVGFLAYSYAAYNDGGARQSPLIATWHDREQVIEEISQLKEEVDILFVSIHAGGEYRRKPEKQKTEFAREAIDAGADAVIGHHPHWIQPVEIYRGKPIFYSLGNFVFDQGDSVETSQGLMVEFRIKNRQMESTRLLPVAIERYCCPTVADSETKKDILAKIGLDSDEIFFQGLEFAAGK
ncbi:MAG: CapA family protein [bacterium]